jgi:oxygen-dependent protoporphyrinogen oxidase
MNESKKITADLVISAIPAYEAGLVFGGNDSQALNHFNAIYYPPVKVLYLVYKKEAVGRVLDGFGFLIPEKENKKFLGAIWSSTIFSDRSDDDFSVFTLYLGGARSPEMFDEGNESLIQNVIKEFNGIMEINEDPLVIKERMWSKAIPQYNTGHIEHERFFEDFEKKNPGIFLTGNYRGGIAVGDCIKNSKLTGKRIVDYLNKLNC